MQERVAVVAVEGQEPIALYGVEPLNFTTQLNRSAVPARLSLMGRHSTIPCLLCEKLNSQASRCNSPCCVFVAYSRVQAGSIPKRQGESCDVQDRSVRRQTISDQRRRHGPRPDHDGALCRTGCRLCDM